MEIEIPFNDWSKDRIRSGDKFATSRNKKYGEKGDFVRFEDWKLKLMFVVKIPLWFIRAWLYESEGCENSDEFVTVWCKIHPRKGWVDNQEVWYHCFEMEYDTDKLKFNPLEE